MFNPRIIRDSRTDVGFFAKGVFRRMDPSEEESIQNTAIYHKRYF